MTKGTANQSSFTNNLSGDVNLNFSDPHLSDVILLKTKKTDFESFPDDVEITATFQITQTDTMVVTFIGTQVLTCNWTAITVDNCTYGYESPDQTYEIGFNLNDDLYGGGIAMVGTVSLKK